MRAAIEWFSGIDWPSLFWLALAVLVVWWAVGRIKYEMRMKRLEDQKRSAAAFSAQVNSHEQPTQAQLDRFFRGR